MFSVFGKKAQVAPAPLATAVTPATPLLSPQAAVAAKAESLVLLPGERFDTTLRPACFGLPMKVSKEAAAKVGAEKFKKYEYLLYIGAQLSRLVYCDTGIMWYVIEKSLGRSNDIVNKVISAYDWKFLYEKRAVSSAPGSERTMESYSLKVANPGENSYATYISTPSDMTCLIINASKIMKTTPNPNSILKETDVFVSFKGSSTIKNFWHDLKSQFTASDLGILVESIGVKVKKDEDGLNLVTGAFVKPLVKAWSTLMPALSGYITADETRLFLCGHSLGGAYCSLFAFILAEGKESGTIPLMKKVKSIHILSYGAPTILSDSARNTFNRHLESGLITLDRVVSQAVAARGPVGVGNDIIPNIPAGFSHPGFRPLVTEWQPEAGGRPYSMDNIRKFYGVAAPKGMIYGTAMPRYRYALTWPFPEDDIGLGDIKNSFTLRNKVKEITGLEVPEGKSPEEETKELKEEEKKEPGTPMQGGLFGAAKAKYSKATLNHIPDFVSVAGSVYALTFAHAEYLGMFFAGGFRLAGMKNPGYASRTANFQLFPSGVKLSYEHYTPVSAVDNVPQEPVAASSGDDGAVATAVAPPVAKGGYRKLRKTRKAKNVKSTRKMKKTSKLRR